MMLERKIHCLVILLLSFAVTNIGFGQCSNCDSQWPTGSQSTTSTSLTQAVSCAYGGEYSVYNVTAGQTYTWTTCGATTIDTQLSLYTGNSCGTGLLAYNDDACGLQSSITWTATFTGQVNLLLSQFNCISNSTCQSIYWACASCGTPSGCVPAPYPVTDPCYQEVVNSDSFCCTTSWDALCEADYEDCNGGSGTSPITTCSGNFYDSGGAGGNYANNENYTVTYCPATTGECISAAFTSFNIEFSFDYLFVYDGISTAAPLLQGYTGTQLNGVTLQANNASGCLTFEFDSDFSEVASGWIASITCVECPNPPPPAAQDCSEGVTICSNETFNGNSGGPGNQELNASNQGCLSFENESSWYFFSPQNTGTIAFMLEPNPAVDYDFAIWGPYDSPSCPPNELPIRCSWSADWVDTGLEAGAGDVTEGAGGDAVVDPITVGPADVGKVYMLFIDNWTASTTPFTFNWNLSSGMSLDCTVLPVELLNFEALRKDHQNYLSWETASETNSDFFAVERSLDAAHYEEIGQVSAAGHSSTVRAYSFVDDTSAEIAYYRLRQVDFDGAYEYFGPIAIGRTSSTDGLSIGIPYPNPVEDGTINFDIHSPRALSVHSSVLDLTGRVLMEHAHDLKHGAQLLRLDLNELSSGMYYIQVSDDEGFVLDTFPMIR